MLNWIYCKPSTRRNRPKCYHSPSHRKERTPPRLILSKRLISSSSWGLKIFREPRICSTIRIFTIILPIKVLSMGVSSSLISKLHPVRIAQVSVKKVVCKQLHFRITVTQSCSSNNKTRQAQLGNVNSRVWSSNIRISRTDPWVRWCKIRSKIYRTLSKSSQPILCKN